MTESQGPARTVDWDSRDNPSGATMTEFMEKYDHIVRAVIWRHVPQGLGDRDDLAQEIWTQFIEGQVDSNPESPTHGQRRSYLEIYDPRKSSPKTYMWEFTRLRCLQFLSRSQRTPTANAFSIQPQPSEEFVVGIVDPETTDELGFDESRSIEFADLERRALRAIQAQKIRGKRDLRWVWHLLIRGYRQDMIAREMGLSEGTISICMDLIRQIPEVQELRKWAVEQGMLEPRAEETLSRR